MWGYGRASKTRSSKNVSMEPSIKHDLAISWWGYTNPVALWSLAIHEKLSRSVLWRQKVCLGVNESNSIESHWSDNQRERVCVCLPIDRSREMKRGAHPTPRPPSYKKKILYAAIIGGIIYNNYPYCMYKLQYTLISAWKRSEKVNSSCERKVVPNKSNETSNISKSINLTPGDGGSKIRICMYRI